MGGANKAHDDDDDDDGEGRALFHKPIVRPTPVRGGSRRGDVGVKQIANEAKTAIGKPCKMGCCGTPPGLNPRPYFVLFD